MTIREMIESDRQEVLQMMTVFYTSPAVHTNGSTEIYNDDITACVSDDPFVEGYVFDDGEKILGYTMVAKSFSTEFGRHCIWIEDIYIKPESRGLGLGGKFFRFIEKKYPDALLRLEVEKENERAVGLYTRCGYDVLPYMEMKKLP